MPPRPQRRATPRRNTLDGPGRRKSHRWQSDNASRHSRSSLDVLLAWLTTPGNYSRWAARSPSAGESGGRLALCREINALVKTEGIAHRKDMDIYAKVVVIEKSFHAAKKWLEETALMPKFLQGTAGKDVDANVNQLCKHYKELAPAFSASINETAASKVVDVTQRSSSDESDEDEDDDDGGSDDGGKSDTTTSTDDAGASEEKQQHRVISRRKVAVIVNGASIAAASEQRQQLAEERAANWRAEEVSSSQPEELYTMSPVHDADAGRASKVTNTAAQGNGGSRTVATTANTVVRDEYEEAKENEPEPETASETEQRATPPTAPPSSSSASPSKHFKPIRPRKMQELIDEDSEPLGTPVQQMPATTALLSASTTLSETTPTPTKTTTTTPTKSATPTKTTPTKTATTPTKATPAKATTPTKTSTTAIKAVTPPKRASSPASTRSTEKPSIAPKRKTSGMLKEAIAASSAAISSPASARKKQKTQVTEPKKTVKQLQEEEKKQQQQHHHPEELQAILRACEEEREQRHTLFQLQCDKLMQELEEKKIKVVYETALARKKLLDIGVAQSEVDRVLPL